VLVEHRVLNSLREDDGAAVHAAISPWADFDPTTRNAHPKRHRDSYPPVRCMEIITQDGFAVNGHLDPTWSAVVGDSAVVRWMPRPTAQMRSGRHDRGGCQAEGYSAAACEASG
jgi:hypothetical protein